MQKYSRKWKIVIAIFTIGELSVLATIAVRQQILHKGETEDTSQTLRIIDYIMLGFRSLMLFLNLYVGVMFLSYVFFFKKIK